MLRFKNHITVTDYAQQKNVSRQAVLQAISKGKLKAIKIGYSWLIPVVKGESDVRESV